MKSSANNEAAKRPEEAPSKDKSAKEVDNGHSKIQDAKKVAVPQDSADTLTGKKPADSQQDADAPPEEAEAESQVSATARGKREPEQAAAVATPATDSKPEGRKGATAAEKGTAVEPAQAHQPESKEVDLQNTPSDAAIAKGEPSASKPAGGMSKGEESAKQQIPVPSAAAVSATPAGSVKSAESDSGARSEVGMGEAPGKKDANLSDEQKAILERGGSLLAEADEVDPKGIQLIRHMQVGTVL